jgi:hypothetical protein
MARILIGSILSESEFGSRRFMAGDARVKASILRDPGDMNTVVNAPAQ